MIRVFELAAEYLNRAWSLDADRDCVEALLRGVFGLDDDALAGWCGEDELFARPASDHQGHAQHVGRAADRLQSARPSSDVRFSGWAYRPNTCISCRLQRQNERQERKDGRPR